MRSTRLLLLLAPLVAVAPAAALARDSVAEGTYEMSAVEVPPRVRNAREVDAAMDALYPPELRAAGVAAEVVVRMRVDRRGVPWDLRVTSSTRPEFDAPTLAALARLRLTPAEVNDRPVEVWIEIPVAWRPED